MQIGAPMLFDPARHEPLRSEPWSEAAARAAIREIVGDICRQFDPSRLWRMHPAEGETKPDDTPRPALYDGAAGVVWALHRLHQQGAAEIPLDLATIAAGLDAFVPPYLAANEFEEASYFLGRSGVLLLQWKLRPAQAIDDALFALVEGNLYNKALESLWGSSGTLVAALHMLEAKQAPRWQALFRRGIEVLWNQMHTVRHSTAPDREVWAWTQDLYGKQRIFIGAGHGLAGNVYPVIRGARWLDADVVAGFEARTAATLQVASITLPEAPGQRHWEVMFDPVVHGLPRWLVQDCHGSPGIVCRLSGSGSAPLQAMLREGGEQVWAAGPLVKRPGLCHGTDGNGYAFLKLHATSGDAIWLDRARAFAMHALQQSDAIAATHGRRVPSVWSGDLGLALYLQACITGEADLPLLDVF